MEPSAALDIKKLPCALIRSSSLARELPLQMAWRKRRRPHNIRLVASATMEEYTAKPNNSPDVQGTFDVPRSAGL